MKIMTAANLKQAQGVTELYICPHKSPQQSGKLVLLPSVLADREAKAPGSFVNLSKVLLASQSR